MPTLFTRETTALIYGRKSVSIQRMLDFDYLCERAPSVAAVIDPTSGGPEKVFFGGTEFLLPVYRTLAEAHKEHPQTDVLVNFASQRSAGAVVLESIDLGLRVIATIAEGVPERESREWIAKAKRCQAPSSKVPGTVLIGPATVGAVTAGAFRIGDTGGSTEHLIASKLHRPGCVGYVGKSGGLSNEMFRIIASASSGIVEGVAIGGDRYPGSTLTEHLLRYQENPDVHILVLLSEIGGREEEEIANLLERRVLTKPLIAWVSGTSAEQFPKDVQFGHAGAWAESRAETAAAKNMLLKEAGALVPGDFEGLQKMIANTYVKLRREGRVSDPMEPILREIPADRRHTRMQCTISSDLGDEATYGTTPIADFIVERGIVEAVARLWWKTDLKDNALRYLEMVMTAVADHGPAVAGAHNAIVAATAGKDPIDCLCSGLLTIGPRFGGAVDSAARGFSDALHRGLTPAQFVDEMKEKGERIPGIGHKVKSLQNPDTRVQTLLTYARSHWKKLPLTQYALEVERITTGKKPNLILNVDGTIAVTFMDIVYPELPKDIRESFFEAGYLNGLFALGRSIGILGHVFDQKRLRTPLYRHPQEDILYGEGILATPNDDVRR